MGEGRDQGMEEDPSKGRIMQIINVVLNLVFFSLLICRINEVFICSWWWIFVPTVLAFLIGFGNGVGKQIARDKLKSRHAGNLYNELEKIRRERMI